MTETLTPKQRFQRNKVGVHLERDLLAVADFCAAAEGMTRRQFVKRAVKRSVAANLPAAKKRARATDALVKIHKTLKGDEG